MPKNDPRGNAYTRVAPVGMSEQLWRANLSGIRTEMITWRQMVAAHNRIYLRSKDSIAALDAMNGQVLWSAQIDVMEIAAAGGGTLVGIGASGLVALDGRNGTQKWTVDLPDRAFNPHLLTGYDFVMVATHFRDNAAGVHVYDAADGREIPWNGGGSRRVINQFSVYEYPTLLNAGDGALLCISARTAMVIRLPDSASGSNVACVKGRYMHGIAGAEDSRKTISAIADEAGKLIETWVKSDDPGKLSFVSIPTSASALGFFSDSASLVAFNPTDGSEKWRQKKGWPMVDMIVAGQRAIAAFDMPAKGSAPAGAQIQSLDLTEGKVVAKKDIPGVSVSAIIAAYRKLYVLGHYDTGKEGAPKVPVVICYGNR